MHPRRLQTYVTLALAFAVAALTNLVGGAPARVCASEGFPYVAYVNEPETYVRSGPGNEHYPTGQLASGFAVEVYRHDGEGWCAIRPPEGSFSLAPAHQVKILDSRTAEVTASGVVARVGSGLGEHRNAVQVLLERGEAVQLVEQPTPGDPWVKIAPPAGEFRWIASRRLSRMPPMEIVPVQQTGDSKWQSRAGQEQPAQPSRNPEPTPTGDDGFAHLQSPSIEGATTAAADAYPAWHPNSVANPNSPAPAPTAASADQIEVVAGSPAELVLAQHQDAAGATSPENPPLATGDSAAKSGQPRVRFPGLSAGGPVDPRVAEMQLRLSKVVVQQPTGWQLASLREETAALLAQEQSPQVRDQLRDLLDRIATFEAVQARYRATPALATATPAGSNPSANDATAGMTGQTADVLARVRSDLGVDNSVTPTPGGPTPPGSPAATEALYDAVGTLKPVVSRRDQAPRYALVDDHGDVVTFVTASADVNLQPYIGKRIGVRGNRGFMPEYRRAHVTASRVTSLEEKLVR